LLDQIEEANELPFHWWVSCTTSPISYRGGAKLEKRDICSIRRDKKRQIMRDMKRDKEREKQTNKGARLDWIPSLLLKRLAS
jgi:hypothetical protein